MPTAPTSIQVDTIGGQPNQLLVTWQPPDTPNGLITEYAVFCLESENEGIESGTDDNTTTFTSSDLFEISASNVTVLGSDMSAIMGSLDPYMLYACTVIGYTSVGEGDASTFASGVTDQSSELDP